MTVPITYQPKWKETLVGCIGGNYFHVEITMGVLHVYFPTEETWIASAPSWASGKWKAAKESAEIWCGAQNIPFTVDNAAWVAFPGTKEEGK
jgi:hypothetical protein